MKKKHRRSSSYRNGRKFTRKLALEMLEERQMLAVDFNLLKDINTSANSSSPGNFVAVGSVLFFTANDGTSGTELWKSDGTAAGTARVKDIYVGISSSSPSFLTNVGGTLYFRANDGTTGAELWKSDGTEVGTVRVKDIRAGANGSFAGYFTNAAGTLFFVANDGTSGSELWKSDGTDAGTVRVKDINSGLGSLLGSFFDGSPQFGNVGGTLYFKANDGTTGAELWKSDGTEAGTVRVRDISTAPYGSKPTFLTNLNGTLYFRADGDTTGQELWKSNGTEAGTVLVKDVRAGSTGSFVNFLGNIGGTLYFTPDDGTHGWELWKSNGTAAGTVLVKDIRPGAGSSMWTSGFQSSFTNVAGTLYFQANDGTTGFELWKSDGTESGTVLVKDISAGSSSLPDGLTNVGGTLYFSANDGTTGYELWKSDGTESGTVLVKDFTSDSTSSLPEYGGPILAEANGRLFVVATTAQYGSEIWVADLNPPTLTGDYNTNNAVDAADYVLWRHTLGSTTNLQANGNNTGPSAGVIDQADYDVWRNNFGNAAPAAGSGAASAPVAGGAANLIAAEPSNAALVADNARALTLSAVDGAVTELTASDFYAVLNRSTTSSTKMGHRALWEPNHARSRSTAPENASLLALGQLDSDRNSADAMANSSRGWNLGEDEPSQSLFDSAFENSDNEPGQVRPILRKRLESIAM